MRLLEIYQEWLEHDGKVVKIDGVNHRMGDHWSTDVLDSDIELAADILSQARAVAAK